MGASLSSSSPAPTTASLFASLNEVEQLGPLGLAGLQRAVSHEGDPGRLDCLFKRLQSGGNTSVTLVGATRRARPDGPHALLHTRMQLWLRTRYQRATVQAIGITPAQSGLCDVSQRLPREPGLVFIDTSVLRGPRARNESTATKLAHRLAALRNAGPAAPPPTPTLTHVLEPMLRSLLANPTRAVVLVHGNGRTGSSGWAASDAEAQVHALARHYSLPSLSLRDALSMSNVSSPNGDSHAVLAQAAAYLNVRSMLLSAATRRAGDLCGGAVMRAARGEQLPPPLLPSSSNAASAAAEGAACPRGGSKGGGGAARPLRVLNGRGIGVRTAGRGAGGRGASGRGTQWARMRRGQRGPGKSGGKPSQGAQAGGLPSSDRTVAATAASSSEWRGLTCDARAWPDGASDGGGGGGGDHFDEGESLCSRRGSGCRMCGRLQPSLFIIGSLKTGTTSLWGHLVDLAGEAIATGRQTDKGDISRKEKDFFGDPTMWRRGRQWYERIWPPCPDRRARRVVGIDATPAYHVWHDAPHNMRGFFGAETAAQLRLVWMMRDPIAKFWSYFWELKAYRGEWDKVSFGSFLAPKLAATRACLSHDKRSPLWPPSMPPPFRNCAPHLDHGLYAPQLERWLSYFAPGQLLLVSFGGYVRRPAAVVRDVMLHAGFAPTRATAVAAGVAAREARAKGRNSKAGGRGGMPAALRAQLRELYQPFVDRLYAIVEKKGLRVSPCEDQGTRFLDAPNVTRHS